MTDETGGLSSRLAPGRRFRTIPFRMSFPVLPPMPPRVDEDTKRETYQLAMLFPPGTDQAIFITSLSLAMSDKFGDRKNWPKIRQTPNVVLKDFEKFNNDAKSSLSGDWKGWLLVRANAMAKNPPNVVGPLKGPDGAFPVITDLREIYGGRWARATLESYYFDVKGKNSGVTFGLCNVQLGKADTPFGAVQRKAEQDFDDMPEEFSGQGDAFEKGENAPQAGW